MIVEQIINEEIVLHYSDQEMKIRQIETGYLFNEAGDSIPCPYTYEETDIPLDPAPIEEEEIDIEEAFGIITGEIIPDIGGEG